ncbi:MAG TPA: cell division protein ZipA C-terminal FtsZ-binding domain-containing protein [Burkholderiales bacterium]|nr:cell division protein ZipA C-terminal FtsZ-binding domain-containing protein [Burkholderiales bacterium]
MSDLHLSLVIIGLIFIAAVFFFNRWQEHKYRKQAEKMFRGERRDVLFDEPAESAGYERIEPTFHNEVTLSDEAPPQASHTPVEYADVEHWESVPSPEPVSPPLKVEEPVEQITPKFPIDEAVDLIAVIRVAEPVSGADVASLMTRAQTFSKPVHWEAMVAGRWSEVMSRGQYVDLRLALQLADRRGPATNEEISRFIALVHQFATELDGEAHTEAEESAATRATELDGFCADVDVEIGVNLINRDQPMPGTKIRALAEASGLKLNADGVFHFHDEHSVPLFTLRNSEPRPFTADHVKNISTRGVTLLLDVPRVASGLRAFDQMMQLGSQIANALGGDVVDDNGKPLTGAGADAIRRQLGLIYRDMNDYGIPAGGPLALRLFS